MVFLFFFQAEDGIRDADVTGVQTCALPICVHRTDGRIDRVELTTELGEYWCMLAAHAPRRLIETVAAFAGEPAIRTAEVFGSCNPFDHEVSPEERERAFSRVMLAPHGRSPYNNGERAICCLVQETNSLPGLLALAVAATTCRVIQDSAEGPLRSLNCLEAIPLIGDAAQPDRGPDPARRPAPGHRAGGPCRRPRVAGRASTRSAR